MSGSDLACERGTATPCPVLNSHIRLADVPVKSEDRDNTARRPGHVSYLHTSLLCDAQDYPVIECAVRSWGMLLREAGY
eukprot:3539644-Rhodomonas_salina.4